MDQEKKAYQTPELTKYGSVENLTQMWTDLGSGDWLNKFLPEDIDVCPWGGCGS